MMDIQVGNPNNVWLLAVIVGGLLATTYAMVARGRAVKLFSAREYLQSQTAINGRHWVSTLLVAISLLLISFGLLDVRWGKTLREVPQKGIEVMFVLDVSRSMLAEDASPNRLNRAKQQMKDMIDEMAGDRIGLVLFAGETKQAVPLTSHYEDFKQTLDLVGIQSVRLGGSRLGDAIDAAGDGFMSKTNDHRAVVIFTDGEDQESNPVEVATKLHREKGIRIFTVGLGDMDQGARIPDRSVNQRGFVEYEGQQVWSKMNGQILRRIATETDGAYIPAGTKQVDMADIYHRYLADVEQTEFDTAKINAYIPQFQWFALPALFVLLLEMIWSTRRQSTANQRKSARSMVVDHDFQTATARQATRG